MRVCSTSWFVLEQFLPYVNRILWMAELVKVVVLRRCKFIRSSHLSISVITLLDFHVCTVTGRTIPSMTQMYNNQQENTDRILNSPGRSYATPQPKHWLTLPLLSFEVQIFLFLQHTHHNFPSILFTTSPLHVSTPLYRSKLPNVRGISTCMLCGWLLANPTQPCIIRRIGINPADSINSKVWGNMGCDGWCSIRPFGKMTWAIWESQRGLLKHLLAACWTACTTTITILDMHVRRSSLFDRLID